MQNVSTVNRKINGDGDQYVIDGGVKMCRHQRERERERNY